MLKSFTKFSTMRAVAFGLALAGLVDAQDTRPAIKDCISKAEKWAFQTLPN